MWRILLEEVDLPTANILKSLLEESGIEVLIKPGSFDPVIFGQGGLVQILVTEEDFEKAQKILREASKNEENTSI
ncbi:MULTISPECIES: putative signal transducing protein [Pseudothermotoga]|uniref:DUF2007 domain-containing protein n=1 Tax=Pseudothermotoga lettingae (strain ATCC BAA-301 / DSM 14385 / NBRC 107922 / TMO) TaxID=416591 RepID=A8F8N0_PSELT|nr:MULTISPECIES: DUF2007 domain-containing protein [Pseudothermotoga]ABV34514.1 hypothetical protein Tlet_1960 [Pseudothermotoga lettingae TMO]KUK20771.1 MAG: Uncharacterized protein XD56_1318 [Pseudothermotoga lettingae]MDI3494582.1 hypothetical protein [Pseudothermotoga sp.]MDK2883541.1 hypothetical protein [Pseudothermotoga sp.]GLI48540.1 hypothetical protein PLETTINGATMO_07090 [Pseudothermotoga lettingae TMO]